MNISELLVPELQNETRLVETFLKRLPEDKLDWKPHEKSMDIALLASHLVELYDWIETTMNKDVLNLADYNPFRSQSVEAMLSRLPEVAAKAEASLNKPNEVYWQTWTMKSGDKVLMEMPRYTVLRSMVFNQFPHHKAQLGVYFRMLDIPVPASYGPSADEN